MTPSPTLNTRPRPWVPAVAAVLLGACGSEQGEGPEGGDDTPVSDAVTVDTSNPRARAQYDANVAFATQYRARCVGGGTRPRVLITGFGRFLDNTENATGRLVSTLVPAARYPLTQPPGDGGVDLPGPQTSVGVSTVRLPTVGEVEVCAMVLPVYWDLAAILALKEIEAFDPDAVVMNGIAGGTQPLWIELGSVNRAMALRDGSDVLVPQPSAGQTYAPLVPSASSGDMLRGMLLSWGPVRDAALEAIARRREVMEGGNRFGEVLQGARFGGFPRDSNTYLCNNLTYVVNYAMAYPGRTLTLLQASIARRGSINRVTVRVRRDLRAVPRVFVHWPSTLRGRHLEAGGEVLAAMLDAQLRELRPGGVSPTVGDNARAEILPSGMTF